MPQFAHLLNGDKQSTYILGLMRGLNECSKCLEEYLVHNKCHINVVTIKDTPG